MVRNLLGAENLTIGYKGGRSEWRKVASGLSFSLIEGETVSLLGLNGAGKSTLLRTLCGFQPAFCGRIDILGRPIDEYSSSGLSKAVAVVLTDKTVLGGLTVYELVSLGRYPHTGFFGSLNDKDRQVIERAMEDVGISHKSASSLSELSDGERQRAMIAKAIAQEAPIIVLDEPTAFLDVVGRMEIMSLLHATARREKKAILLSTHDIENAMSYSDKLLLLSGDGKLYSGTPEQLVLEGRMKLFFSDSSVDFDAASGRLSLGSTLRPIGVSGDPLTVRWLSNALFREGFSPVIPSDDIISVYCRSSENIEVKKAGGEMAGTFTGIVPAVKSILAHTREGGPDERDR